MANFSAESCAVNVGGLSSLMEARSSTCWNFLFFYVLVLNALSALLLYFHNYFSVGLVIYVDPSDVAFSCLQRLQLDLGNVLS